MKPVPIECPGCGRVNDTHAEPGLAAPTQGDMGICWGCREPYIFDLLRRRPTDEERAELEADDDFRRTRAAMLESHTPSEATELRRLAMSDNVDLLRSELRWALDTVDRLVGESLTKLNAQGRAHFADAAALVGRGPLSGDAQ